MKRIIVCIGLICFGGLFVNAQEFKDPIEVTVLVYNQNTQVKDGETLPAFPESLKLGVEDTSAAYIFTWEVSLIRKKQPMYKEKFSSREAKLLRIRPMVKPGDSLVINIHKASRRRNDNKAIEPVKPMNKFITLNLP